MENPSPGSTTSPAVHPDILRMQLESKLRGGAHWFFWIAAFSLVNSAVQMFGGEWSFIVGLGVTQVVDGIGRALAGSSAGGAIRGVSLLFDFFLAGGVALFGFLAGKRMGWAFVVGW